MKILLVGSGGREHALLEKISQSSLVQKIFVAPGNGGMQDKAECLDIKADDIAGLLSFAQKEGVDLTVVGPELPLTLGIVDQFEEAGLKCFGPSERASIVEGSKVFTKEFCKRHNIPTAHFVTFSEPEHAKTYIQESNTYPAVIKADGLAAGKGVIIAKNFEEAEQAIDSMLVDKTFGDAGSKIVVEDFLPGEEASFFILTDGKKFVEFPAAQDHKRVFDNDEGPNTGGMGAYAPAPVVTDAVHQKILDQVVHPTLVGLKEENRRFVGFLYIGLMIDAEGNPQLIEYNCRLGDPEAQVILPLLDSDLVAIMLQCLEGKLDHKAVSVKKESAATVVLASEGYPGSYKKGHPISGLDQPPPEGVFVYHAGTAHDGSGYTTQGGRVLSVTATHTDLRQALSQAYAVVEKIDWPGRHYRKDIGKKAL